MSTTSGMELKPSPKMKTLYFVYILPPVLGWVVVAFIPFIRGYPIVSLILFIGLAAFLGFFTYWVPRFYVSAVFRTVEGDNVYRRYGVWWVKENRLPYKLISQLRIRQGPLQRKLKLAPIDIFTPATGALKPEVTFFNLTMDDALKAMGDISSRLGFLTREERKSVEEMMLEELKAIRSLLNKMKLSTGKE